MDVGERCFGDGFMQDLHYPINRDGAVTLLFRRAVEATIQPNQLRSRAIRLLRATGSREAVVYYPSTRLDSSLTLPIYVSTTPSLRLMGLTCTSRMT